MPVRTASTIAALLLLGLGTACTVAPGDEPSTPEGEDVAPPAVVDDGVDPAAGPGGGTSPLPSCGSTCTPFCKFVRGRWICGETCICIVKPGCVCPTL
ncbi:MAG: hypothetical protein JST00_08440 [Deltaproteobacteria bacterium]|nr:hypothetical protein [Deltaproteobacteria bacterium]